MVFGDYYGSVFPTFSLTIALCAATSPPGQPTEGPAGSDYAYAAVQTSAHGGGDGRYWLYEPADPAPASAPVVLYLHGYGALDPSPYEAMLNHVARKGFTVVYPRYGWFWNPWEYEQNAINSLRNALDRLEEPGHVAPELEHFAVAGHSLGGILSLRIANRVVSEGLPVARAIVLHDGAGAITPAYPFMPLDDLDQIDASAYLVVVIAESSSDDENALGVVRRAWLNTPQIARDQRNGLLVRSDDYGEPDLVSDHLGVNGPLVDAVDWFGYWKPTVAILHAAFYGTDAEHVLGEGPEVREMGSWSDGEPVVKIGVASDLGY